MRLDLLKSSSSSPSASLQAARRGEERERSSQEYAGFDFGTFGQTCEKQVWLKSIIVAPGGCQVKFW